MKRDLISSALAVLVFTALFGLAYPLLTTGAAQVLFPNKADGSQVERGGKVIGSRLIGQDIRIRVKGANGKDKLDADGNPVLEADPRYFQSRPSATGYSADVTFFNNLGPNSKDLKALFDDNVAAYLKLESRYNPGLSKGDIPPDAVQTSASGVDPHISEDDAQIQARRVAEVRGLDLARVQQLVEDHTDGRGVGLLGEPGVNVLELNLALDRETA
jgi:K+-transporting ATPase ATPase C chain